ncbi:hypothetical protein [Enterovibrio norvegicus]|uniref:hypothetical protein n=1 Tax=Enterovibrio norvegicus TaxID=188144 RepID=UPI0024B1BD40|nr:hypothetical protein [Enterovibrio norvegicus]
MQQSNIGRGKAIGLSFFLIILLCGGWLYISLSIHETYQSVIVLDSIIDINVYGLWVPVGFIGVLIYLLCGVVVTIWTGTKASYVWGAKGNKIFNYIGGSFAVIGLLTAMFAYDWMTDTIESKGYTYCKPLSRLSAMGHHEVYVSKPELCVKRSREQH